MWYHLHLIPLQQGTEVPTASWPAYEDGHFFIKLASGSDDAHPPSPASQSFQILFRTGTYFVRQGSSGSTVRINGTAVSLGVDTPLLQSDLIEFGCAPARKYRPSFTCRIDLNCSPSPLPAFPGPYTHTTSNLKLSSICFDDIGRALDDSARHYGHKHPCPPLRPAAFSFTECTVTTSSLLPRQDDAPLPAFFPHVPTSSVSASTPSSQITISFAPPAGSSLASSAPVLPLPTSPPLSPSSSSTTSVLSPAFVPTSRSIPTPTSVSTSPSAANIFNSAIASPILPSTTSLPSPTIHSAPSVLRSPHLPPHVPPPPTSTTVNALLPVLAAAAAEDDTVATIPCTLQSTTFSSVPSSNTSTAASTPLTSPIASATQTASFSTDAVAATPYAHILSKLRSRRASCASTLSPPAPNARSVSERCLLPPEERNPNSEKNVMREGCSLVALPAPSSLVTASARTSSARVLSAQTAISRVGDALLACSMDRVRCSIDLVLPSVNDCRSIDYATSVGCNAAATARHTSRLSPSPSFRYSSAPTVITADPKPDRPSESHASPSLTSPVEIAERVATSSFRTLGGSMTCAGTELALAGPRHQEFEDAHVRSQQHAPCSSQSHARSLPVPTASVPGPSSLPPRSCCSVAYSVPFFQLSGPRLLLPVEPMAHWHIQSRSPFCFPGLPWAHF
ncbi:hypothetical protein CF326_g7560 [Tilletia indica]|nr:hypothetical protein CF326_g7560 [Tilletia indica]